MTNNIPFDVNDPELQESDPEGYTTVIDAAPYEQRRWMTSYSRVIANEDKTRFFRLSWDVPNTEYQDTEEGVMVVEVYPHKVMTTIYKKTPQDGA